MIIRKRGQRIQLSRSVYKPVEYDIQGRQKPGTGRGQQAIIGTFEAWRGINGAVDLLELLNEQEQQQLKDWFNEQEQDQERLLVKYGASDAIKHIERLTAAYEPGQIDEQIEQIAAALAGLRKARRNYRNRNRKG